MDSSLSSKPDQPPRNKSVIVDDDDDDPVISKEELDAYFRQVKESKGFDVDNDLPAYIYCGAIAPIDIKNTMYIKDLQCGAEIAIKDYNQQNDTNFEVVEIEKATRGGCFVSEYYITFKVKPFDTTSDYPTTTFQAKVTYHPKDELFSAHLCRIKKLPSNDNTPISSSRL